VSRKHWVVVAIFGVGFGLIGYLGWFLLVAPVRGDIAAKQEELSNAKKKLEEAQAKAAQKEKFQAMAENVRRDLALVASRVDPVLPVTELYYIFSSLGNRLALPKYEFAEKPREGVKDTALPGMERIPLKVKFQTGFHQAGQYLNSIVSLDRLMVLEGFTLKAPPLLDGVRPPIDCEMELSLFLEAAKPVAAAAAK
jgi:Tfp pilus assembly protein PilO